MKDLNHLMYMAKVIKSCKTLDQLMEAEFWAYRVICRGMPQSSARTNVLTAVVTLVQRTDREIRRGQ